MKIAAISDLHGQFPSNIPECDVLVVAGDICPDIFIAGGRQRLAKDRPELQLQWFENTFVPWLEKQPAGVKLVTWGNHDFCGQVEDPFLPNGFTTQWDGAAEIYVTVDSKFELGDLKFWLTPWSNLFMDWAWMKPHTELAEIYAKIPDDTDVIVSHQPPYGCGDIYPNPVKLEHIGSSELLYTVERVQPKAVICGHLHGGYGRYQIDHPQGRWTEVHNVSICNEDYQPVNQPTVFEL